MADYYPLIARAVQGLADRTPEIRRSVYERARVALMDQLRSLDPPLSDMEIERERVSLDEAIERVEANFAPPPPSAPPEPVPFAAGPPEHDIERFEEPPREPEEPEYVEPSGPARPRVDSRAPVVETGSRRRAIALGAILAVAIAAIAVAAWFLRDRPGEMPQQTPVAEAPAPRPPEGDKFNDRVGGGQPAAPPAAPAPAPTPAPGTAQPPAQPSPAQTQTPGQSPAQAPSQVPSQAPSQVPAQAPAPSAPARPDVSVAQRAIFYEEDPANPQIPKASPGRAVWRLETVNAGQGQPLETAVRAVVEIPDAGLTLNLLMRRNADPSLPASHTVELNFSTKPGDPGRAIRDVGLLQFKNEEAARGTPVAGLPVPVRENLFLIGLSNLRNDIDRNMELILRRNWIDLPIRTAGGQRAILSIEKGAAGEQVFNEAFRQWQ